MKPFPLPVRSVGPGSQVEDDTLNYLEMPQGMATFNAPILPEPDEVMGLTAARQALRDVHAALQALTHDDRDSAAQAPTICVSLDALDDANRRLINQVLGEGEVSAQVRPDPARQHHGVQVQESVYAGVWRVLTTTDDGRVHDHIEIGPVPQALLASSARVGARASLSADAPLPPGVMNAPAILSELDDQLASRRTGRAPHVINLTLLPLTPEDLAYLGQRLGEGDITVLSRGYGNCRVTSTAQPDCWQVVYFNSQDHIILNTIEVTRVPDVVSAAQEDLQDSLERVGEAMAWLDADTAA